MAWTQDSVMLIFCNGVRYRGKIEEYSALANMLNEGRIIVDKLQYAPVPLPVDFPRFAPASGGDNHRRTMWYALNWLWKRGETQAELECTLEHGRADVAGFSTGTVCEVGDTSPGRVAVALSCPCWNAFALFPFPYVDILAWRSQGGRREQFTRHEVYVFTAPNRSAIQADVFAVNYTAIAGL